MAPGRYDAPLPVITIRPAPRSSIPGITARQQRWTPSTFTSKVRHQSAGSISQVGPFWFPDARVRHEQLDRPGFGDRTLDRLARAHVQLERAPADLGGDGFDLIERARRDDDAPTVRGERAGDVRADPASAAGNECDARAHARNPTRLVT